TTSMRNALGHQVVERAQHVNVDCAEQIVQGHILVRCTHVVRCWAVHERRDALLTPEAAVGRANADTGVWTYAADGFGIVEQESDHLMVRITPCRLGLLNDVITHSMMVLKDFLKRPEQLS